MDKIWSVLKYEGTLLLYVDTQNRLIASEQKFYAHAVIVKYITSHTVDLHGDYMCHFLNINIRHHFMNENSLDQKFHPLFKFHFFQSKLHIIVT